MKVISALTGWCTLDELKQSTKEYYLYYNLLASDQYETTKQFDGFWIHWSFTGIIYLYLCTMILQVINKYLWEGYRIRKCKPCWWQITSINFSCNTFIFRTIFWVMWHIFHLQRLSLVFVSLRIFYNINRFFPAPQWPHPDLNIAQWYGRSRKNNYTYNKRIRSKCCPMQTCIFMIFFV